MVEVANAQGGCVARRQLTALGFSARVIAGWIGKHWLVPWHYGVYSVGHWPRTHEELWWAAVLACGDRASTSHRTSAAAHALMRPHRRIHVTTPAKRSRPGIATHQAVTDTVYIDGLPCTTVARTLVDLAGCVPFGVLESVVRQAQVRGVLDVDAIGLVLLTCPRARGIRRLRAILDDPVALAPTRSGPERVALRALLAAGHDRPVVGRCVSGTRETVDFHWPELRLVLEIDGPSHLTSVQRARDERRDRILQLLGYRVVRVADHLAANSPALLADAAPAIGLTRESISSGQCATPVTSSSRSPPERPSPSARSRSRPRG